MDVLGGLHKATKYWRHFSEVQPLTTSLLNQQAVSLLWEHLCCFAPIAPFVFFAPLPLKHAHTGGDSAHFENHCSKTTCVLMRANFTTLESRVDGCPSISWKLLNTFRLLILVCTTALVSGCLTGLPIGMVLHSECHSGMALHFTFRNVVPFKNAQLEPKPASTDKLTPVIITGYVNRANYLYPCRILSGWARRFISCRIWHQPTQQRSQGTEGARNW